MYKKTRRFSHLVRKYDSFEKFETLVEVKCLRTFFKLQPLFMQSCLSNRVLHDVIPNIRCLRVLSLCGYWIVDLPDSIGNLKYLRFLNLSHTPIKRLPESVCSLYNLQIILLSNCRRLCELPRGLKKLINLRYLRIRDSGIKEMPDHIGQLRNLQELSRFIVGQTSGRRIGELRGFSEIRGRLHISELQNVVCGMDALEANLKDKKYVDDLVLEWKSNSDVLQNGIDIVNNLQPHENVKRLTVNSYGGTRFPDWLGDRLFLNMVFLNLKNCQHCSSLPSLGQLSSLKHLHISGMHGIERVGTEFYVNNSSSVKPFTSLETLVFEKMRQWKEWVSFRGGEGGAFPHLQVLCIRHCPNLTGELPCELPSLTTLQICRCQQLVASVPRVSAIRELKILNCGQVLFGSPPYDFTHLQTSGIEISNISQWKELPQGLRGLTILKCVSAESLLEGIMQNNTCLQHLILKRCCFSRSLCRCCLPTSLKSISITACRRLHFLLPEFLKCDHPLLERLRIEGGYCRSISAFSFGVFPKLTRLEIYGIEGLESLSISISEGSLPALDILLIHTCYDLVSIEFPTFELTRYEIIHCKKLKSLMCSLSSFEKLILRDCPLLLFPVGGSVFSINSLRIDNCDKLTPQVEWGLQGLASLAQVSIRGGCQDLVSFPKEGLLPSTLTSLVIESLPNLKSLDGKGLQLLTSLKKLCINDCQNLQSLPKEGLPTSISFLKISNCPLLKNRCQFWKGEDWQHIAHIPRIVVDDQVL